MNLLTELKEGLAISWDAIRANKLRSTLTTLGIVIGIVTVTLMGTAIEGLNQAFLRSISAIGADVLFIQKFAWFSDEPWWKRRNRREIMLADAKALARQTTHALAMNVESYSRRTLKYGDRSASAVSTIGHSEDGAFVMGLNLSAGRFFNAAEVDGGRPVCVIGADVATNLFKLEPPLGKKLRIAEIPFEVIGIVEKRGKFMGLESLDNMVFVPITRHLNEFAWRPGAGVTIQVKIKDIKQLDEAREDLHGIMRIIRRLAPGDPDDFFINEQQMFIRTFQRISGIIASVGLFITGLSLFVGGIGIMNIMFVSVAERTREIGIRKAIGAKRRTILIQFLIEAASICLLGGLIALAIAFPVTRVMMRYLPAAMSPTVVSIALAVSIVTGVAAGFLPAWRAARMNPVDALRSE